jgi:NAD(P)-dependent dehydrogenase (short-subunit alcohol dehydrogenase family)
MARRVVITGGASGLGREMAQKFLSQGDRVAICDVSRVNIEALKQERPEILGVQCDVTDELQMQEFFDQVQTEFGGVDIFLSNAGTGGPAGLLETIEFYEWRDCVSVNLDGAFLSCRWAGQQMRAQGSGVILIISSTSGLFGVPNRAPYVTAKWGLIGLMKTLAMELGPAGVRVNAICPGSVDGDRMERVLDMETAATGQDRSAVQAQYTQGVSLRKFMSPQDIAEMAFFLASEVAQNVTGQAISVDGNTERMV